MAIPIKEHEMVCVPVKSWREYLPSKPLATVFVPLVIYAPGIGSPSVLETRPEMLWALTPTSVDIIAKHMIKSLFCIYRSKYIQREVLQSLINSYTTLMNYSKENVF